jgi:hypothetical protein
VFPPVTDNVVGAVLSSQITLEPEIVGLKVLHVWAFTLLISPAKTIKKIVMETADWRICSGLLNAGNGIAAQT